MKGMEDFIKRYAEASGLDDRWAVLGVIEISGSFLIALPCGCEQDACEGWAMVSPSSVNTHLKLYAPNEIREAFLTYQERGK